MKNHVPQQRVTRLQRRQLQHENELRFDRMMDRCGYQPDDPPSREQGLPPSAEDEAREYLESQLDAANSVFNPAYQPQF